MFSVEPVKAFNKATLFVSEISLVYEINPLSIPVKPTVSSR
jgi:hypothetical protein